MGHLFHLQCLRRILLEILHCHTRADSSTGNIKPLFLYLNISFVRLQHLLTLFIPLNALYHFGFTPYAQSPHRTVVTTTLFHHGRLRTIRRRILPLEIRPLYCSRRHISPHLSRNDRINLLPNVQNQNMVLHPLRDWRFLYVIFQSSKHWREYLLTQHARS
jgi:hypothetical protein